jgi:hypothetical protein
MHELSVAVKMPERTPPKMMPISSSPGSEIRKNWPTFLSPGKGSTG